jgi:O-antigen/teichoic acid export membrane protein
LATFAPERVEVLRPESHLTRLRREAWALGDQALVSGMNFMTNVLLARLLGIKEFGIFTLAWMAVLFFNSLQMALVISPMMSIGPKQDERDAPVFFSVTLLQQLVMACLTFVLLLAGVSASAYFFPKWHIASLALPLAFVGFSWELQEYCRRYFFTVQKAFWAFLSDAISYAGQVAILALLFWKHTGDAATALYVIGGTSLLAVLFSLIKLPRPVWPGERLKPVALRNWHFAKWLAACALMQWSSGNFFIVAATWVWGASAAGVFRVAQSLIAVTHVWFQGLENVLPATASRLLHFEGRRSMMRYLRGVGTFWGGVTALFAVVVSIAPNFWLKVLYGPGYVGYGFILRWYAVLYLIMFANLVLRAGLRAVERTRPIFWSYVATTSISLLTAVPLTRYWSLNGTMFGMLFVHAVALAILIYMFAQRDREAVSA